jgi:hypothetical protein
MIISPVNQKGENRPNTLQGAQLSFLGQLKERLLGDCQRYR